MENNEIIQRLLQDDKPSPSTMKDGGSTAKANRDGSLPVSRIRVVTAKYKVYIVLLLIFIFAFVLVYIPKEEDSSESINSAYNEAKSQSRILKGKIKDAKNDIIYLRDIVSNEKSIKACLNSENSCSDLPEEWESGTGEDMEYNLSIPLSYLQLHSLYNKKMPVDEKIVLKNLNEYLIKQDISGEDRKRVGDILKIEIGDPKNVYDGDEHFFEVPVDVEIEFTTVEDLIGFLYNVEKKLIDKSEDRILYKIQAVSYDVVSRDEPQITDISMIAYYYHDEKFDDVDEYSEILGTGNIVETTEEDIDEDMDDPDNSDSIFQNIFKNFKK